MTAIRHLASCIRVVMVAATLCCAPSVLADHGWRWVGVDRVVAFGDVHGAYRELVSLLQRTGVIDGSLRWSGGNTHLVSLGDLVDRGPDSRAVLDLLMRLENEAPGAGGVVHVVLGNHEVMNLTGDRRYVSEADYAAFAAPNAEPATTAESERERAFAPNGRYGAWLLQKPALIVIDDTAYVHGGLTSAFAALGLERGNVDFHDALTRALAGDVDAETLLSDDGPVWYRGTALCHVLIEGARLQHSLQRLSVRRVVVGHTPTRTRRVSSRFGGNVVMLDTGMLTQVYRGRPSALVISNGGDSVASVGGQSIEDVMLDRGGYSGEWIASDRLEAQLESAPISAATLVSSRAHGERDVTLAGVDGPIAARFVPLSKQALQHEVAAYRLDRLLGLGMVAPSVAREIDGKPGLLSADSANWISERQRIEKGVAHSNPCEVGSDYDLVRAFDALIGKHARSADDLGYDQVRDEVRLRGHADAFATSAVPPATMLQPPQLPRGLRDRLAALDERAIVGAVGDRLKPREIKALLVRRDTIVGSWPALE